MAMENLSSSVKARLKALGAPRAPKHLRVNYRRIGQTALDKIAQSLKRNYFADQGKTQESYLASTEGRDDFENHMQRRTDDDRYSVIPWLNSERSLRGARILEIGCGTGSSTVAFAEQGAEVTAVDIDEPAVRVARDRCEAYGLQASFSILNAMESAQRFSDQRFDFIIFYASLEHMTHQERLAAMKSTWDLLEKGSLWCVIEAPNRLWHTDVHTSLLPFFNWLPNDLAFEYSRFSPRESLRDRFREHGEKADLDFLRLGRGVSYHEFDLAIRPSQGLDVRSSMLGFLRRHSLLWRAKARIDGDLRYESFLASIGPPIHRGFFQARLDLIIKKD
jgi:S-adenosylmethionine-dependent methyltransferase